MPDQGDELTKVENLINMVIPQAKLEGFEPRPTPADWTEGKPGAYVPSGEAKPIVNRFERAYSPSGSGRRSSSTSTTTNPQPVTLQGPRGRSGARSPSIDGTSDDGEPDR